jgi:hypothetical protein
MSKNSNLGSRRGFFVRVFGAIFAGKNLPKSVSKVERPMFGWDRWFQDWPMVPKLPRRRG